MAAGIAIGLAAGSCAGGRPQDTFTPEEWVKRGEQKLLRADSVRLTVRSQAQKLPEARWYFETKGPDRVHFSNGGFLEGWDEGKQIYVRQGKGAPTGRDWTEHEGRCVLGSIARGVLYGWQLSHAQRPDIQVRIKDPIFGLSENAQSLNGRRTVVIDQTLEIGSESGSFEEAGTSRVWIDLEAGLPFRRQTRTKTGEVWIERYQWWLDEPMDDATFHAPGA